MYIHLHTLRFSDIVPLHYPLTKVDTKIGLLFDWFQRHQMEPIAEDLSIRKPAKHSLLKWNVKIVYPLNSD